MSVLKDLEEELGPLPIKTGNDLEFLGINFLPIKTGNDLEFLGINFQFTDKGTVKLYCRYQIEEVKDMFPDDIALCNWIDKAQSEVKFQGLRSRI